MKSVSVRDVPAVSSLGLFDDVIDFPCSEPKMKLHEKIFFI
jgi:hypothetical protein